MAIEDALQDAILSGYEHKEEGKLCTCGRGLCLAKCCDCLQYGSSCLRCFADHHFNQPFHWVRLWDSQKRFFKKVDYSLILQEAGMDAVCMRDDEWNRTRIGGAWFSLGGVTELDGTIHSCLL